MKKQLSTHMSFALLGALLIGVLSGCSTKPQWEADKDVRVHSIASSQLPPEPVYSRLRWVHPPEVLPTRQVSTGEGKDQVLPIISLKLTNATLEETANVLAATSRYRAFVASAVSKKRITIQRLGTIEELARDIERMANIEVLVDHETRSVRFFERLIPQNQPSFSDY